MSHPEQRERSTARFPGPARTGRSVVSRSLALLGMTVVCGISSASAPSRWRPEDRTVIGEMLHIYAVASSFERLYVVSAEQVLIRDPGRIEWQGPFGGPGLARAQDAVLADVHRLCGRHHGRTLTGASGFMKPGQRKSFSMAERWD